MTALIAVAAAIVGATIAGASDVGLQVEVDPKTGAYSLPPPGRLPETVPRAVVGDDLVITPGTSAAGGFKATPRDLLHLQSQPGSAVDGAPSPPAQ
jgi:hypothetical protein